MLAANINADMVPSSAGQVQMETNMLAALSKTLQGIESIELNLLAQTLLGHVIEWAVSRFGQMATQVENAFDTTIDEIAALFTGREGTPAGQTSPPQPPDTSSPPEGGIRPLVAPFCTF